MKKFVFNPKLLVAALFMATVHGQSDRHECVGKDLLLEFKAAYFLSTSSTFKNIYGNGSAIYGPEFTFKMYKGLYGWASFDFFTKNGKSFCSAASTCGNSCDMLSLTSDCSASACSTGCSTNSCDLISTSSTGCGGDCTSVFFMPIGIGIKYFVPFETWHECVTGDFYLGLGIQPTFLQTKDSSPYVYPKHSNWGVGGIAKIGAYFDLPRDFFIDVFFDYSFNWVKGKSCAAPSGVVVPVTANLSGCLFGGGIGYRFN